MLSFHVKFVQTDRRMDGRTTVKKYAPDLLIRGHKNKNKNKKNPEQKETKKDRQIELELSLTAL